MNPPDLLRKAVEHLEQGEWEAAHGIVQSDDSVQACWLHGIVHVLEGDLDNARYWYRRAGRAFSGDAAAEIAAARKLMPVTAESSKIGVRPGGLKRAKLKLADDFHGPMADEDLLGR